MVRDCRLDASPYARRMLDDFEYMQGVARLTFNYQVARSLCGCFTGAYSLSPEGLFQMNAVRSWMLKICSVYFLLSTPCSTITAAY